MSAGWFVQMRCIVYYARGSTAAWIRRMAMVVPPKREVVSFRGDRAANMSWILTFAFLCGVHLLSSSVSGHVHIHKL